MLELVKGCHNRTGSKQFLLSVFLFVLTVPYSTVSICSTTRKCLVYPEFLINSVCIRPHKQYSLFHILAHTQYLELICSW